MAINTLSYLKSAIKIKTKTSKIVPLIPNSPQMKLYNIIRNSFYQRKPVRVIILKARQMGFSTMTGGIICKNTSTKRNVTSAIVAHKEDATTNLFNMYKLMYENLPPQIKPSLRASNAKELVFNNDQNTGLNSKIRCMTANSKGIGRSFTINYLHVSELAFWEGEPKDTMLGLLQAVPDTPDSMIIIESTANGYDYFKEMWDAAVRGDSDFVPLFVGWNELPEYATPVPKDFRLTRDEELLKEKYSLSDEQIYWRRLTIRNKCNGDVRQFQQEYPICPEEAFLTSGNCVFNQEKITERLTQLPKPITRGFFNYKYDGLTITDHHLDIDDKGPITIWEYPEPNRYYTIGCDTAGEGSDYFYAHVIDNTTCEHMARYRLSTDETLFARQIFCLGRYYNDALINVEANFSTYPIKELVRLGYPNLWVREKEDKYTGQIEESYGFKTTKLTRPILIGLVKDAIREHIDKIKDEILLQECLTFIRTDTGREEAMNGKHDDGVMSYGITLYSRDQQNFNHLNGDIIAEKKFKWPQDLLDDYYKADEKTRERMISLYGEPN